MWRTPGLFVLLGMVPTLLVGFLAWRDTGAGVQDHTVVMRSRRVTRRTAYVPRRRIQSADSAANLFQRRRDVASFSVVAASGATGRVYVARDLDARVSLGLLQWAGRLAPAPML
jgi:uncharacterized membrane protein YdbT with pleckstrin-like domain